MHTPAAGLDPASQEIGPATEHLGERLEAGQCPFRDTKVRVLVPEGDLAFVLTREAQGHPTGGGSQEVEATGIALVTEHLPYIRDLMGVTIPPLPVRKQMPTGAARGFPPGPLPSGLPLSHLPGFLRMFAVAHLCQNHLGSCSAGRPTGSSPTP